MDHTTYMADDGMKKGKLSAYKNHIIKKIEEIGQKKLVIIGGGEDYSILMQAMDQLRHKSVKVPDVAFRATVSEGEVSEEQDIRFISELKGKAASFYALIIAPYTPLEIQLAAMEGIQGTSAEIAAVLKAQCGYTDSGFCELNEPSGLGMSLANMKLSKALASDGKRAGGMENGTAQQMAAYRNKMKGQRCFILGNYSAKLDELNGLMNEHAFACNEFCDFFTRTPQRPEFFLLTKESSYLGNGKYIEGMESFVDGRIRVFEDKFKKKPTYFNGLGAGLINGLPSFQTAESSYGTAVMFPMYVMLQLALYMGFSEIYLYGWDGLFPLTIDENGAARKPAEGECADFPADAKQLLEQVKKYAEGNGSKLISMCETNGFSMLESVKFEQVDLSASSIFGRI
ncbi:MAG: hypothetical protein J6A19_05725 [Oscillospiraceae bacterium]|nr:hypothetical protein [Oscillospiraceae bacterium]